MKKCKAVLAVVGALMVGAPAYGQYAFLDVDGDGLNSPTDVIDPSVTSVDIYFDTLRNRDGSPGECAESESEIFISYEFALRAGGDGTVAFNGWTDNLVFPHPIITAGDGTFATAGSDAWVGRGGAGGSLLHDKYKLGTLSVTVTGTPTLTFLTSSSLLPCAKTAFGSNCVGRDFDNTIKFGCVGGKGDWADADGVGDAAVTADAGPDQTLCAAGATTAFTLSGTAGDGTHVVWTVEGGTATASIADPTSLTSSVTVTGTGFVTLKLTTTSDELCASASNEVALTVNASPSCTIGGDGTVCTAATGLVYTVSSPVAGAAFVWSIEGNGTIQSVAADGSSATVNAGAQGTFTLSVVTEKEGCSGQCEYVVNVEDCGENCPRTAGFWSQQCAQKSGTSTKFTVGEVTQVAGCVDDHAALFSWGSGTEFSSFCTTLDPPSPMNQRKQARRQFATFLANVCTGQLGLIANNGDEIFLDLSTPFLCAGLAATTLGELIGQVDGRLVSLEGQPLSDPLVKDEYSNLIVCLDAINNGIGIGAVCPEDEAVPGGGIGLARGVAGRIFAALPSPNPFAQSTYFVLSVTGTQSKPVSVRVFDVSGRLVRAIVTGSLPPGRHEMAWDGYSDQGRRMPTGVYFLQSAVGRDEAVIRLLYMR